MFASSYQQRNDMSLTLSKKNDQHHLIHDKTHFIADI